MLALCVNTPGDYKCQCLEGWTGDGRDCSGNVDFLMRRNSDLLQHILNVLNKYHITVTCNGCVSVFLFSKQEPPS